MKYKYFASFFVGKKNRLILLWLICVSSLVVQFLLTQLLTQLTTVRLESPQTFKEIFKFTDRLKLNGSDIYYMKQTGKPEILELANITHSLTSDIVLMLKKLVSQNYIYFLPETSSGVVSKLLNPSKFVILEEKYLLSPYVFYISRRFRLCDRMINL